MDIYSLGIMAFEMVVGRRPFFHENYLDLAQMHLVEEIPDFATKESGIPKWYQDWVQTCCQKRKDDRFHSADEAAEEIVRHIDDSGNMTARSMTAVFSFYMPRKLSRHKRKRLKRIMVLAALTVCTFVGVFAGMVWFTMREPVTVGRFFAEATRGDAP